MQADEFHITKISYPELRELQAISLKTFSEAYAHLNSAENMADYLARSFSTEQLRKELDNPESEFYFAKIQEQTVAYLKINSGLAQTENQKFEALEIERIYVLADYQGRRIGQALIELALSRAQTLSTEYIWLGVWEQNPQAIQFYKKNGFTEFGTHYFQFGDEKQIDIMMRRVVARG
ncbi:MAG: GNAT family N-acetyltransferase [Saprospiraceae bacterium]|nr:GNAT family N-acetyltransferase [Saprospiraceae bacterium]